MADQTTSAREDVSEKREAESNPDASPPAAKRVKLSPGPDSPPDEGRNGARPGEQKDATSGPAAVDPPSQKDSAKKDTKQEAVKKEWVGRRRGTRPEGEVRERDASSPRLPKRQCAMLIGFCGTGYNGMQIQPKLPTIEGVLFKALVAAGAVSQDNADDPVKVGLNRAARTDAGVHAAGNVISLKLITVIPDLLKKINDALPPEIRVWSFQRVQNSFNARQTCDSRRYTYFFPTYLLIPPKPGSAFAEALAKSWSERGQPGATPVDTFWADGDPESAPEDDMKRKKAWRVGQEQVEALRKTAERFLGTHNFHNFTIGRDAKDRSCQRHIKKIEIEGPVVYGDTEWLTVKIHGQSFMLHQRKMMCVLVMIVRTGTPATLIDELYGRSAVTIPKMPSLGLLLECPVFESYNTRMQQQNRKADINPEDDAYRGPIDFEPHAEEMLRFKEEHIYAKMRESEEKAQVFDRWVQTFDKYQGDDLLYYNPEGKIPDIAVVRKGEKRKNTFKDRKHFDATDFRSHDGPKVIDPTADVGDVVEDEDEEERMNKKELAEAEG